VHVRRRPPGGLESEVLAALWAADQPLTPGEVSDAVLTVRFAIVGVRRFRALRAARRLAASLPPAEAAQDTERLVELAQAAYRSTHR
jgi:hypothetical protein